MGFDTIIANGNIIDGAGNPWYRADIGITAGKISKIGAFKNVDAKEKIDATDLVVCPAFAEVDDL